MCAQQLFSLVGAVVAPALAAELKSGDAQWMKKASSRCQVRWSGPSEHRPFIALGTVDQVKEAQGYLQEVRAHSLCISMATSLFTLVYVWAYKAESL